MAVVNAGAQTGAAGNLVEFLVEQGYSLAEAQNAEEGQVSDKPVLIYHNRNFKNVAKNLRQLLVDNGYAGVTYRINLEQGSDIMIVLGPAEELDQTNQQEE